MTAIVVILSLLFVAAIVALFLTHARAQREHLQHSAEIEQLRAANEIALRDRQQQLQAILDSMVEGILVLDAQNHVIIANRAAGQLFKFTPPVSGHVLIEVVRHHEIAALATRLRKGDEQSILDHELRLEDLPPRFLQINAVSLRNPAGAAAGAVFVFHDVTRIRELEGLRQEFVANVSHELRTPLSLITSAVETLLDGAKADADTRNRLLLIIERHAQRLTLLIDDLLLLARLDSGRLVLDLQPVALRTIVQEVIDDIEPRAKPRGIRFQNDVAAGLVAIADASRLSQVLWNLIDNAIKYGRPSGVVTIGGRELSEQLVELSVQDDGAGIPLEAQDRIFERFYRADKARSREQGGTGLGLAIVKHVVQAHGGEVRVESEPGHGSTFYFSLRR